jgi:hypothetical protein
VPNKFKMAKHFVLVIKEDACEQLRGLPELVGHLGTTTHSTMRLGGLPKHFAEIIIALTRACSTLASGTERDSRW